MAKSDSFFIRAKVTSDGTTYKQEEIDLGSFVNLGVKSSTLVRVHGVDCAIRDEQFPGSISINDAQFCIGWQLTTQTQTEIVGLDDKSVVASGSLQGYPGLQVHDGSAAGDFKTSFVTHDFDQNPRDFRQGYLVGVDSMYLATDCSATLTSGNYTVEVILECTLETATQASATALALSQQ